jgi:CMP-N,N'-diacetyllegionaminic acid synthase
MIGGETVLAIVTARGGSKGLPRKNVRDLGGKPLIAWSIEAAKRSDYVDRVVLSSEDEEIMSVARKWGCDVPFARPAELATDEAPGIAPVIDVLQRLPGYAWVVLLQPTSPLRRAEDVDACIKACVERRAPACVSVTLASESPYWMYTFDDAHRLRPLLHTERPPERRQDLPASYVLNGAVYVARSKWLLETKNFIGADTVAHAMPAERSVDIDDESDFEYAKYLLQRSGNDPEAARHGS